MKNLFIMNLLQFKSFIENFFIVKLLTILENMMKVFSQEYLDFTFGGVINLIDGEEFINKLVEYQIGVRKIKDYEIIDDFLKKI